MKKNQDRIDYDEMGLDDVVINDVEMFRLERMNEKLYWARCYKKNGEIIDFHIFIKGRNITGFAESYKKMKKEKRTTIKDLKKEVEELRKRIEELERGEVRIEIHYHYYSEKKESDWNTWPGPYTSWQPL